jgi:excisionase family DNA binding protein
MIGDSKQESMLTVSEVAKQLHVHPNTLRRWVDEGKIVAYRITRRGDLRFEPSDVNNYIKGLNPTRKPGGKDN